MPDNFSMHLIYLNNKNNGAKATFYKIMFLGNPYLAMLKLEAP